MVKPKSPLKKFQSGDQLESRSGTTDHMEPRYTIFKTEAGNVDKRLSNLEKSMDGLTKQFSRLELQVADFQRKQIEQNVNQEVARDNWVNRESGSKNDDIHHRFADSVTGIIGLKEIVVSRHRALRYTWLILFLMGIGATVFFTYKTASEYLAEPTATKIKMIDSVDMELPPIALCPDAWLDAEKAVSIGLSLDAVKYSLGYTDWRDIKLENESKARQDFLTFYSRNGFKSLLEFYKSISIDIPIVYRSDIFETLPAAIMLYSNESRSTGKVFMNGGMCFSFSLKSVDLAYTFENTAAAKLVDKTLGILGGNLGWSMEIGVTQATTSFLSIMPGVYLPPQTSSKIMVLARTFLSMPSPESPCLTSGADKFYTMFGCMAMWQNKIYKEALNCQIFEISLEKNETDPKEYCHFTNRVGTQNMTLNNFWSSSEGLALTSRIKELCQKNCPRRCDKKITETVLQWQKNVRDQKTTAYNGSYVEFNFDHMGKYEGGVMTLEDVSTYSYADLVNNVGGTFGLFVGGTLLTFAQLILFIVDYVLEKRNEVGKVQGV